MGNDTPAPIETVECWLLRRVAQAVEAGEVSAKLLTDLQAKFEAARAKPQEEGHAEAVQDIAAKLDIPLEQAETRLAEREAALRQAFAATPERRSCEVGPSARQ